MTFQNSACMAGILSLFVATMLRRKHNMHALITLMGNYFTPHFFRKACQNSRKPADESWVLYSPDPIDSLIRQSHFTHGAKTVERPHMLNAVQCDRQEFCVLIYHDGAVLVN